MPLHDVPVRRIVLAGAFIAATVLLVVGVIVLELRAWGVPLDGERGVAAEPTFDGAALESAPQAERQRERDAKQRLLNATGPVDGASGMARIPIATAMALMTQQGLRAATDGPPPGAAAASGATKGGR
jgi:hypothetical protein